MARELQPCGTPGAYIRHWRRGEPIDNACREAHNAQVRRSLQKTAASKPPPPPPSGPRFCKNPACGVRITRKPDGRLRGACGWCNACYLRWYHAGRPDTGPPAPHDPARRKNTRREDYFWLVDQGESREGACRRVGVTERTAARWELDRSLAAAQGAGTEAP